MKNDIKDKPRFPLFKSLGEIILLIAFIAVFSTFIVNNVLGIFFTDTISNILFEIFSYVYIVIGIGGSILILVDNLSGKQIIKNIFRKIGKFYRHPKTYWKQHAVILTVLLALIIYSQIVNYNNSVKLCGPDGDIYYCESGEEIVCEDGLLPVYDKKTYKCINSDTYKHDYEHKEYDYICTKQYANYENKEHNDELIKSEKECLYNAIIKEAEPILADMKKDLPSSYDVRSKVTVKAGDQGNSNICGLWSETKALEISAQLKGIDYQFLLDFEKQINGIKRLSPATDGSSENLCYSDECIPGKKKHIYISEFVSTSNFDSQEFKYYPEFSDQFKKYSKEYLSLPGARDILDDPNFILNSDEYWNFTTKFLIMKYGSSFILTTDENKYIDKLLGHQMTIIGWDDSKESWLALNSWGDIWDSKNLKSNGDGTTWIKYSDNGWEAGHESIELLGQ